MNSTNRGANRLVIVITGLIIVLLGAAAIAVATPTIVRDGWQQGTTASIQTITGWLQNTPLSGPGTSWLWIPALAALVLLIILLIVFISRQGRGHTGVLFTEAPTEHGQSIIESGVAEQALRDALDGRPEFVSSNVSTYQVQKQSVLKIAVVCRRGVSPHDVADLVTAQLKYLDTLLGTEIPALVQISGGFRARVSRATRLQ